VSYSLSLAENDSIIVLKIIGTSYASRSFEYTKEVLDYATKHSVTKLLIDCTESKYLDNYFNISNYVINNMKKLPDYCFQMRIALLVSQDDHSRDFLASAFISSGYEYKLFHDRDQAIKYIKEKSELAEIETRY